MTEPLLRLRRTLPRILGGRLVFAIMVVAMFYVGYFLTTITYTLVKHAALEVIYAPEEP